MIGAVALATISGFVVAVVPGGLGVREGVLMSLLAPALGRDLAVVAAVLLRLVWVVAELAAAAVLVPMLRPPGTSPEYPSEAEPGTDLKPSSSEPASAMHSTQLKTEN
jgi:glycosyltransferase 2 family protein